MNKGCLIKWISSLKGFSFEKKILLVIGVIVYFFSVIFIADKITFSLVDNKIYESSDFSEKSIKVSTQTDCYNIVIRTNNLTKLHLFYRNVTNSSKLDVQFPELKNASYTIKQLEHTDSISYIEVSFNPSIKKQNGKTLSIKVNSDVPLQFLTRADSNEIVHKQYGFSLTISRVIFIFVFLFCICFALLIIYLVKKCKSPHKLYFFIALIFGGINLFVSTPLGQPDAVTHYESIYNFSNKLLGIESPDGFIMKRKCDLELLPEYYDENMRVAGHTWVGTMKSFVVKVATEFSMSPDCSLVPVERYMTVSPRLEYLPQALLMTLGRLLKLNQFLVYFLVVLGNYLLMISLISLAIKYSKDNYLLFVLLGLHPGIIGMIQSVTYDPIVYSFSLLVISLAFYNFTTENVSKKLKIFSIVTALLLAPMKTVYFPISLLLLISLIYREFDYEKNKKVYKSALFGVLLLFIYLIIRYSQRYTGLSTNYTISFMLHHPVKAFFTFLRTLVNGTDWFNYRSSLLFTNSILLNTLMVYVLLNPVSDKMNIKQIGLFLLAYILIFLFLFCVAFSWTPNSEKIIYGLQNRYFSPIAALFFVAFQQMIPCKLIINKKISFCLIILTCFIMLMMKVKL